MKNQQYIPKRDFRKWRKWLITSAAIAGVLVLMYFYFFVWFEPTGVDAEIHDLTEEMKGFPPNGYVEEVLVKYNMDFLLKKKPTPRDDKREIADDFVKIGKLAVPKLIELLKYNDPEVRSGAAYALCLISDSRAVEPLIIALNDEDRQVHAFSACALGEIGDVRAIEPLIKILRSKPVFFSYRYNRHVFSSQPSLQSSLCDYVTKPLQKIGSPAVQPLIDVVLQEKDEWVRSRAIKALGVIGDIRAVKPLTEMLNCKNETIRRDAAVAIEAIEKIHKQQKEKK